MATEHAFVTLDVFTDRVFGGNPLAVIDDGRDLDTATMSAIAREFNLSETTFVLPPDNPDNTHKVRIFTPVAELDFAGHPTLGTAIHLALSKASTSEACEFRFEEKVGVVPVSVTPTTEGLMRAELSVAALPKLMPSQLDPNIWSEILGLNQSDVCPVGTHIGTWTCGAPFTFVPVASVGALAQAGVNSAAWAKHLTHTSSTGVFVFTENVEASSNTIRARMFAPDHGIAEDSATGSAVAALAGWLMASRTLPDGTHCWTIEQGIEMGRPSRLDLSIDLKNAQISGVQVAGTAVPVSKGLITVP